MGQKSVLRADSFYIPSSEINILLAPPLLCCVLDDFYNSSSPMCWHKTRNKKSRIFRKKLSTRYKFTVNRSKKKDRILTPKNFNQKLRQQSGHFHYIVVDIVTLRETTSGAHGLKVLIKSARKAGIKTKGYIIYKAFGYNPSISKIKIEKISRTNSFTA